MYVPVVDREQKPLMPTKPSRARRWIKEGKATPFWKKGVFCVRLNIEPSSRETQPIVVGIDPSTKKEGFSVKSEKHTYLSLVADAVTWVKGAIEERRQMRRSRRFRNTPCRPNRSNRSIGGIPPSTKARWDWKLRICRWLSKLYPIARFVVEDIKTWKRKGSHRWNRSFSPLEVGKQWFYNSLKELAPVFTLQGYETKKIRQGLELNKDHWVDSWCLAYSQVGGKFNNQQVLSIAPLRFHRKQLHAFQPAKGGVRRHYGGTISLGFKRGSLVKHLKWGLCFIGGYLKNRISLHSLFDGRRLTQQADPRDLKFLTYLSWRVQLLPSLTEGVSAAQEK